MNYRKDKYGNELSILGFGCMRFRRKLGLTDMAEAEREIMAAYNAGINYFDTAYIYPGNESVLGEVFEKNGIREQINIATKLPHYLIKSIDDVERMFSEELKRLRTDYVDYYLMHMLTDADTWARLVGLGIDEWIREKKESGTIRQIGFSYHGNTEAFCRLIDVYDWDFCMIQYNYMDENTQAGRRGLHYAAERGIPVMIMEPLRGGKLVRHLPKKAVKIFSEYKPKRTPAEWALRWLWNQPEVTVVLSGMNSLEMIEENVKTASEVKIGEMGAEDDAMLKSVVDEINSGMKVGCTGCGYCMPCPKGVDIPGSLAAYNRRYAENRMWALADYFICTALRKNSAAASECIGCGKCEKHCPQNIDIRKNLKNVSREMEGPLYKSARAVARKFVKF